MTQRTRPDVDLHGHIANLLTMMPADMPEWERIVVAERDAGLGGSDFDARQLVVAELPLAEDSIDRWDELLGLVDATWISLTCGDIREGALIVVVEGRFASEPTEKTCVAVNLAGFSTDIVDQRNRRA